MIINHNMSAIYANRQLKFNTRAIDKSIERLSSGMRINSAGDDASGLAVSEKMRSQIRGMAQAERNASDGISFIQTTEGYLQETQDILQRLRELSIQSANGIYTKADREQIQVEVDQLVEEIDRIADSAQFNGMKMLTGTYAKGAAGAGAPAGAAAAATAGQATEMFFHVGANENERFQINIGDMQAKALLDPGAGGAGNKVKIDMTSVEAANKAINRVDEGSAMVSKQRANLGAYQNRLEHVVRGLAIANENTTAAESRIRDTDMAAQMVEYTRAVILNQAGVSMLAQANMKSQSVLKLLQ